MALASQPAGAPAIPSRTGTLLSVELGIGEVELMRGIAREEENRGRSTTVFPVAGIGEYVLPKMRGRS